MPGVESSDTVFDFVEHDGSAGAFRDVVQGAAAVINECFQLVSQSGLARDGLSDDVAFDEFNLDARISYRGRPVKLSDSGEPEKALLDDEYFLAELSSV